MMKKMWMLLSLGLLCGSLAFAQDSPGGQMANPNTRTSPGANAMRGCLGGSPGNFTLTMDDTGTVYQVMGDESKLSKHVGHEVSVTGKLMDNGGNAGSTSEMSGQSSGAAGSGPSLKVSHIEMVSTQCKTGGSTPQ